ncbi:MAG: hypothetical protein ACRELX_07500 [Longimicrobiales bacterium]
MAKKLTHDLLLDSEASLRLADSLLCELRDEQESGLENGAALRLHELRLHEETGAADLPGILLRAYTEISNVLDNLRQSRFILERTTLERVQRTQEKLREVSSATEVATIDMLDDLDGALGLVDRLDDGGPTRMSDDDAASIRCELRERLHSLITRLQFQDITAQQLGYASSVLEDVEHRMNTIAELIDLNLIGLENVTGEHHQTPDPHSPPVTVDPAASTLNADTRQAVADEIFLVRE